MAITELILRAALSFVVLFTLTRIMGRKEISQMTFFNFVSAIAIGSIGANLVVSPNLTIYNGVLALVSWSAFTIIMGLTNIKSKQARKVVTGKPMIVIKEGQIMEKEMGKVRLSVDSLNAMLRQQKIFSVADVQYAIFETNGKLSVMKKDEKQTASKVDVGAQNTSPSTYSIPTAVVSDGSINKKNLSKLDLDEDWLNQELEKAGITDISNVFYAEVQKDGTLYIDNKNDVIH